jgi:TRAP-type mannitol/chloroaromatic compound transport system substrate-binding protein
MQRRSFIRNAAIGATAGTLATSSAIAGAPAVISGQPTLRWRLASSFPKSLDTLFGAAENISRRVSELTEGRFTISTHAGGEIVPPLQVLDAVQAGTVEIGHTAMYYYFGKNPTYAIGTAVPFGLNFRQMNAWWYHGGGEKLYGDFLRQNGVVGFLAGNTGEQTGGWFRREINSVEDLRGLTFRISAFGGLVLSRLGVVPQTIPGGEIYTALERGALDAVEWVGPYDDERLGFHKVAKYYYAQAWWEIGPALHLIVNQKSFDSIPQIYQSVLQVAAREANQDLMARYDALNIQALKRLLAAGVQLRAFNNDIMQASFKAAQEVYADLNAKNPDFKRIYSAYSAFQRDQVAWQQVIENRMAQFMATVIT